MGGKFFSFRADSFQKGGKPILTELLPMKCIPPTSVVTFTHSVSTCGQWTSNCEGGRLVWVLFAYALNNQLSPFHYLYKWQLRYVIENVSG